MLKGRRNYICLNRWKQFLHGLDWTVERNVLEAVLPLIAWVGETQTGDIEETGAFNPTRWPWIWAQIRSETGFCRNPQCAFSNVCFVQRVRRAAKTADLVVVNHALLLSDLGSKNRVLAEYSNLIVDEAHNLENAATESLGMEWSYWSLSQFVSQLALAPEDPRCPWKALHAIRQSVRPPHPNFWETLGRQISDSVEESAYLLRKNGELFNVLFQQLSLREVWSNGYPAKIRYRNWMAEFPEAKPVTEELLQHLTSLRDLLQGIRGNLAMVSTRGLGDTEVQAVEELRSTASGFSEGISELLATLSLLTTQNSEEFVYWIDAGNGKDPRQMRICCAPLDVSDLLYENLFERLDTVVFTSATLAVGGSFDHFESRTGINRIEADRRVHKILGSPFDFHRQVRVLIPRFIPSPRDDQFIQVGIQIILRAVRSARRATLALFTSYQMLDRAYEALRDDLRKEEIAVLAQGKSGSRRNLVQMMKEGRAHVLLGTQSFWEGVDLPGEALELLIITKLPFDVPSEPIVEARAERLEKQGKSSFYEYILPNAVLKFRQGFGRLIRSRSDRGVVILLDSRILMSRYGSLFYHSLPVEPEVISDMEELEQKVATWFHQDNGDRVLIYSYEE
jgi:Rad3-related DNA helicase